jgi:hypothetical protein
MALSYIIFNVLSMVLSVTCAPLNQTNLDDTTSTVVVWSSDWHFGPVADIQHVLSPMHTEFIDKKFKNSNQTVYRSNKQLILQSPCRNRIIEHFYNTYRNDEEFKRVDLVLITFSLGLAEVYMPFNKSIAVIAHTRYEVGRHTAEEWTLFNENLRRIAASPYNLVAANNRYDLEYMKYFTGINAVLLPSACTYVNAEYNPTRADILVAPYRRFNRPLFAEMLVLAKPLGIQLSSLPALYPRYEYSDLARHPAIVFLPYQVSTMSIFEFYRMCIPLFFPDMNLWYSWHKKHRLMSERTWYDGAGIFYKYTSSPLHKSFIGRHPESNSSIANYDPNNDFDKDAIFEWLKLSDFYVWPHITLFSSFEHLMQLLQTTDLKAISTKMKVFNEKEVSANKQTWEKFLGKVRQGRATRIKELPYKVNQALDHSYGIKLDLNTKKCYGLE